MREPSFLRPRVTPDPERAAELERRLEQLAYRPEVGFHRDRLQQPIERPLPIVLRRRAG